MAAPIVGAANIGVGTGYMMAGADGGVFTFGDAIFTGSAAGVASSPKVGIAVINGDYLVASADGSVRGFGFARSDSHGPIDGLNSPIVGIAADPATGGYWLVASDGGVFSFGAPFLGSMGGVPLNEPIVGMADDPVTGGYWLVASDGGVFSFGAPFLGSMGGSHLNRPVVGIAADPATGGYWLAASDGGVFSFGAPFLGSMGGSHLNRPVVGIVAGATGAPLTAS